MGDGVIRVAHVMHGLMMGGLEQVVVRLCDASRQFGIEPRVIAFGADGAVRQMLQARNIPLTYLGKVRGMSPQALHGIARALREHDIDLAHAHDYGPWLNALAARTMAPYTRTAVTFHQIATPSGLERGASIAAAMISDALIACGREVMGCIRGWAPASARIELIGNGVPIGRAPTAEDRAAARARMEIAQDAKVVGYLGRLHEEKGVDLLVDAFCRSFSDRPDVHLVLIGKGELEPALRHRAAQSGAQRIHFMGEIVDASSLLAGFDVYVQPSRREGRSLSMLEAMAAGLPTVAQGLPAIREIHVEGETALLVPPSARPDFATPIRGLLDDDAVRTRMGEAARQHVQGFSVEAMAESYANLYRHIVGRAPWTARAAGGMR